MDRAQKQLWQRKLRDRSVVVLILGAVLLLPPVGSIALVDAALFGLPVPIIYVFAVWALLIAAAASLARGLDQDMPSDGETPDQSDGQGP